MGVLAFLNLNHKVLNLSHNVLKLNRFYFFWRLGRCSLSRVKLARASMTRKSEHLVGSQKK